MVRQGDAYSVPNDRELEARVVNNLALHHVPGVRWLHIQALNGVVTLRGRVRSFHQRQRCIHCTRRVAGVFELVDQLEVVEQPAVAVTT